MRCGGCRYTYYCSNQCQASSWKKHKASCIDLQKYVLFHVPQKLLLTSSHRTRFQRFSDVRDADFFEYQMNYDFEHQVSALAEEGHSFVSDRNGISCIYNLVIPPVLVAQELVQPVIPFLRSHGWNKHTVALMGTFVYAGIHLDDTGPPVRFGMAFALLPKRAVLASIAMKKIQRNKGERLFRCFSMMK